MVPRRLSVHATLFSLGDAKLNTGGELSTVENAGGGRAAGPDTGGATVTNTGGGPAICPDTGGGLPMGGDTGGGRGASPDTGGATGENTGRVRAEQLARLAWPVSVSVDVRGERCLRERVSIYA